MRLNRWLPVGVLAMTLGAGGLSAEAAQRGERRDRGGDRQSQGQARERSGNRDNGDRGRRDDDQASRGPVQGPRGNIRDNRGDDRGRRNDYYVQRQDPRYYRYSGPRVVRVRPSYRHYYGSGGHLSVYSGLGSGYRYGSPYYGRVYGYSAAPIYGGRRDYGDVRLLVRPRDAAVYVDGYYAGIVDNFDGVFQRLTLDVGPHEIEIEAPGLEPRVFNVYVDPTRTVDLRGDLFYERP